MQKNKFNAYNYIHFFGESVPSVIMSDSTLEKNLKEELSSTAAELIETISSSSELHLAFIESNKIFLDYLDGNVNFAFFTLNGFLKIWDIFKVSNGDDSSQTSFNFAKFVLESHDVEGRNISKSFTLSSLDSDNFSLAVDGDVFLTFTRKDAENSTATVNIFNALNVSLLEKGFLLRNLTIAIDAFKVNGQTMLYVNDNDLPF